MTGHVENKRTVTVCAGVSGSGKSTFGLRYLVNADLAGRFCFDPDGEFSARLELPAARTGFDLAAQAVQGVVIFDPHELFPGNMIDAFRFFCAWTFEVCAAIPGKKCLQVDEVWKYCTPQTIPPELSTVCQTGRKRGLGLFVNTQRPHLLNGSILNEVSELVCFRLQDENALAKAQFYGFEPSELATLPDLSFVARNLDSGGWLRGKLTF